MMPEELEANHLSQLYSFSENQEALVSTTVQWRSDQPPDHQTNIAKDRLLCLGWLHKMVSMTWTPFWDLLWVL